MARSTHELTPTMPYLHHPNLGFFPDVQSGDTELASHYVMHVRAKTAKDFDFQTVLMHRECLFQDAALSKDVGVDMKTVVTRLLQLVLVVTVDKSLCMQQLPSHPLLCNAISRQLSIALELQPPIILLSHTMDIMPPIHNV
jgi:hypothetical protein